MELFRTDLAMEARNQYRKMHQREADGVRAQSEDTPLGHVIRVEILDERGEDLLGKPVGMYVTLETKPELRHMPQGREDLAYWVAQEIGRLLADLPENSPRLVAGLGNGGITPDSLGPKTVSQILVTRHVLGYLESVGENRLRPVCAIAPGVLGMTGIQTAEIIRGVTAHLEPSCLIAVDALASRSVSHIANTIQISSAGIKPGSGLGNRTQAIDRESLGIPVLSLGIPTVVYATVIARDAMKLSLCGEPGAPDDKSLDRLIRDKVEPAFGDLVVTPKEVDVLVEDMAWILAMGINLWAHPGLSREEIASYLH